MKTQTFSNKTQTFDGLNNFRIPEYRSKKIDVVVENELLQH